MLSNSRGKSPRFSERGIIAWHSKKPLQTLQRRIEYEEKKDFREEKRILVKMKNWFVVTQELVNVFETKVDQTKEVVRDRTESSRSFQKKLNSTGRKS